jgi:hypothetical protein
MSGTPAAIEQRARRAAKRAGWSAKKSRWRADSPDNHGGFMVVEGRPNLCLAGSRYEMSAQVALDFVPQHAPVDTDQPA